jgi:hypothetical protein
MYSLCLFIEKHSAAFKVYNPSPGVHQKSDNQAVQACHATAALSALLVLMQLNLLT